MNCPQDFDKIMVQWAANVSTDTTAPSGPNNQPIVAVVNNSRGSRVDQQQELCRQIRKNLAEGQPVLVRDWEDEGAWSWDQRVGANLIGSRTSTILWQGDHYSSAHCLPLLNPSKDAKLRQRERKNPGLPIHSEGTISDFFKAASDPSQSVNALDLPSFDGPAPYFVR